MKLSSIMNRRPVTIASGTDFTLARHTMAWADVRHLPVVDDDMKVVGILSEHDVVRQLSRERDLDVQPKSVDELMSRSPQTASPDDSLTEAASRLAESNIGCLPVTEKGRLVGMVTRTDVLRGEVTQSLAASSSVFVAGDMMTSDPATVEPSDYLLDAAGRMQSLGVRHLPVVNGTGRVVGILSDRDVRGAIGDPMRVHDDSFRVELNLLRVEHAMTRDPLSVLESDSLATIATRFVDHRLSAAPVVNSDDKLVGIISYLDLLKVKQ